MICLRWLSLLIVGVVLVDAQSPTSALPTAAQPTLSLQTVVSAVPLPLPTGRQPHSFTGTTFIPTTLLTSLPLPTPTSANASDTTSSATPTSTAITLDTHVDPAFGVTGALLMLTGLPSAFWGHKNRWTSFFLMGFYTLALVTLSLIIQLGILRAINPPSRTLRGLFVLSCGVAGFAGGGFSIFFWKATKYFIGAWGGFALALWIQCFRSGGLVRAIGFRWIFYTACATVGFILCTIPKLHWYILLLSTAFVGASSFMLGVDCFSSAGLKEFYVYNLGFHALFPKFDTKGIPFPLTQVMQIEIGLIAAVFLMGASVQLRILAVLRRKLQEINFEEKRRQTEVEARAAERFESVQKDLEQWEKDHGRSPSNLSGIPLLMQDPSTEASTPGGPGRNSSQFSLPVNATGRERSPQPDGRQNTGALPAMDLGEGITEVLPQDFVSPSVEKLDQFRQALTDIQDKSELLAEIQTIRRSIDVLRSTNTSPRESLSFPDDGRPRLQSFSQSLSGLDSRFDSTGSRDSAVIRSRRHSNNILGPANDVPRAHVRTSSSPLSPTSPVLPTIDSQNVLETTAFIPRPTSTPLRDNDWDNYVQDRTLFVPPSGVTPPIGSSTSPLASPVPRRSSLLAIPSAVSDALLRRQKRENAFLDDSGAESNPKGKGKEIELGAYQGGVRDSYMSTASASHSSDNVPLGRPQHKKTGSFGNLPPQLSPPPRAAPAPAQMNILPPMRRADTSTSPPQSPPRTRTFEELTSRHREKLRTMQKPLTTAEEEQARIDAA